MPIDPTPFGGKKILFHCVWEERVAAGWLGFRGALRNLGGKKVLLMKILGGTSFCDLCLGGRRFYFTVLFFFFF
ncbi:hypothetical protein Hanom_Chr16g01415331 [Helianthus anomalus]